MRHYLSEHLITTTTSNNEQPPAKVARLSVEKNQKPDKSSESTPSIKVISIPFMKSTWL